MAALWKVVMHSYRAGNPGNPYLNVFGYRSNLVVVNEAFELAAAFKAQLIPEIKKILSIQNRIDRVEIFNVTDGEGYYNDAYSPEISGERNGETLPDFVSYGYQYNRLVAGKRNGFKRFSNASEDDVAGPVPTGSMLTILNALGIKLAEPLNIGLIDTWFPVILERKPTGVFPWTDHALLSVQYKRITTQNTRKR